MTYQVRLKNGYRVKINIFVVYNHPRQVDVQDDDGNSATMWEWPSISRSHCPKEHCEVRLNLCSPFTLLTTFAWKLATAYSSFLCGQQLRP